MGNFLLKYYKNLQKSYLEFCCKVPQSNSKNNFKFISRYVYKIAYYTCLYLLKFWLIMPLNRLAWFSKISHLTKFYFSLDEILFITWQNFVFYLIELKLLNKKAVLKLIKTAFFIVLKMVINCFVVYLLTNILIVLRGKTLLEPLLMLAQWHRLVQK